MLSWDQSKSPDSFWVKNRVGVVTSLPVIVCKLSPNRLASCLKTVVVVQLLNHVQLFATPWAAAHQAPLSSTIFQSLLKLMSIESVMPSNHLILCHPLLLLPSIFPSIRVFSNESVLYIRWPKYWSFSFSISPSNEHPGLISWWWTDWISLQSKGLSGVFPTPQFKSISSLVLSFLYGPSLISVYDYEENHSFD